MSKDTERKPEGTMSGRKRRVKLPIRAYLVYLLVVASLMTGVTLSKYIVSTGIDDSARVISFENINVVEDDDSNGPMTEDGRFAIMPGADITKKAVVSFGGSESACYVFLKVTAPSANAGDTTSVSGWTWNESTPYKFGAMKGSDGAYRISWSIVDGSDGWTYLTKGTDDSGSYYVYYKVLEANAVMGDTSDMDVTVDGNIILGNTITVDAGIKSTELADAKNGFDISFEATTVQYGGWNGPDEAWTSLSGK